MWPRPDLTGTVTAGPPYVIPQAEVIARAAAGRPAVLVGHSGAGPLLGAAAARMGHVPGTAGTGPEQVSGTAGAGLGRVRGYVFVDAGLPIPGQSWLATVPAELAGQVRDMADAQGWLPPWPQWWDEDVMAGLLPDPDMRRDFSAGCPRLPLAMFGEVHPPVPGWPGAPGAYLQLSEAYAGEADRARALGWPVLGWPVLDRPVLGRPVLERPGHHLTLVTEPAAVAQTLSDLVARLQQQDQPEPGGTARHRTDAGAQ